MINLKEIDKSFKLETEEAIKKIIADNPGMTEEEAKSYYEKLLLKDTLTKLENSMKEFRKDNKDIFDVEEQWGDITGLKEEELNDMPIDELLILVYKKLNKKIQEIESLSSIIPKNYIMPNNRLINKMAKDEAHYNKEFDLRINGGNKKEILTKVSLNYDDDNIQIYDKDKRFTPYDRSVHNSICSLYEAGNINFTPEQVYRCMNGLDDGQYVSPQSVGAITRSLDKTRHLYARVDYTDEAKAYNKDTNSCIIEDYILSAKKVTLEAGGEKVTGYKLNSKPILYHYAQITGQVLTVPSKLLNTKECLNSTPEVIVIREYLIRRIEVMKRNKKQSNKILFNSIYEEINNIEPTKEKAKKVRDTITKLLGRFKELDYIKDFTFYKEGRGFKGIEIYY